MSSYTHRNKAMMAAFQPKLYAALEAEKADGKVSKEIEYMYYARLTDVTALLRATSMEIQQQWGLWYDKTEENAGSGSIRVRKTISHDIIDGVLRLETAQTQYVQTIKLKTPSGDALEIPSESSEHGMQAFMILADSGMIKHRYVFPIPGQDLKWEVDMFLVKGSDVNSRDYMPWCKLDLEVPRRIETYIAPPECFVDMFDPKQEDLTEEQQRVKEELKSFLGLPNPIISPVYKDQQSLDKLKRA
jgi:hypothetical protein